MGKDKATEPALVVQDTSVKFGDFTALYNIDLEVKPGEMVALIGASGSGKSTLLRTIDGLQVAAKGSGRILVFGRKVQRDGRLAKGLYYRRRDIGMIFQSFNLVGRLSLFSNVLIGVLGRIPTWRGVLGLYPAEDRQRAMDALERVGVAEFAGRRASKLSGGQKQRIAIARALYKQPEILVLDEATSSLDSTSENYIQRTIKSLREQQKTIILIAHRLSTIVNADEIVVLENGKVIEQGSHTKLYSKKGHYYNLWKQQTPNLNT